MNFFFILSFIKLSQKPDVLLLEDLYCYIFHLSLSFSAKIEFSVTLLPNQTLTISLNVKIFSEA